MTIKEVEERTGLSRSNVRFYEREKLISPQRKESNGYREYSDSDIEDIKKIAYLRTLGISVEDIRNMILEKLALHDVLEKQNEALKSQITDLNRAKYLCEKMLGEENVAYKDLRVEKYVAELPEYWNDNRPVFKADAIDFLHIWGGFGTWIVITGLCLLAALLSFAKLPPEIPVQWSGGAASSLADKKFIFAYPAVCMAIRCLIRPLIYAKLQTKYLYGEMIAGYLANYLCFVVLSAEIFSILFLYGAVKNIVLVFIAETVVLIGLLVTGLAKKGVPVA